MVGRSEGNTADTLFPGSSFFCLLKMAVIAVFVVVVVVVVCLFVCFVLFCFIL